MSLVRHPLLHHSITPLLQKDLPLPAADMSILRQICFGDAVGDVEKSANAFDQIETNVGDLAGAQPFMQHPSLHGYRHLSQGFDGDKYQACLAFVEPPDCGTYFLGDYIAVASTSSKSSARCGFRYGQSATRYRYCGLRSIPSARTASANSTLLHVIARGSTTTG